MFFTLSKLFWAVAQPLNALCLLGLAGFGLRFKWPRAGQRLVNTAFVMIPLLGLLPVGPFALTWLENRYPISNQLPKNIDGIILLGGPFEGYLSQKTGHIVSNDQADRALCFVELAQKYPDAKLVFTGGAGDIMNPEISESHAAKKFFALSAIKNRKIIFEEKSRNTFENAVFSKEMVKPKAGEVWALVTTAYHMPRSMAIFEKQNWPMMAYPCDHRGDGTYNLFARFPNIADNFGKLNAAVKEFIGLFIYAITGKI